MKLNNYEGVSKSIDFKYSQLGGLKIWIIGCDIYVPRDRAYFAHILPWQRIQQAPSFQSTRRHILWENGLFSSVGLLQYNKT